MDKKQNCTNSKTKKKSDKNMNRTEFAQEYNLNTEKSDKAGCTQTSKTKNHCN